MTTNALTFSFKSLCILSNEPNDIAFVLTCGRSKSFAFSGNSMVVNPRILTTPSTICALFSKNRCKTLDWLSKQLGWRLSNSGVGVFGALNLSVAWTSFFSSASRVGRNNSSRSIWSKYNRLISSPVSKLVETTARVSGKTAGDNLNTSIETFWLVCQKSLEKVTSFFGYGVGLCCSLALLSRGVKICPGFFRTGFIVELKVSRYRFYGASSMFSCQSTRFTGLRRCSVVLSLFVTDQVPRGLFRKILKNVTITIESPAAPDVEWRVPKKWRPCPGDTSPPKSQTFFMDHFTSTRDTPNHISLWLLW